VLRPLAGESAQDLLGLGGTELQRPRALDHLVVLLGDQIPVDRPGEHPKPQRLADLGPVALGGTPGHLEPPGRTLD